MPVFEYTARNVKGEIVQNKGEFATRDDVLAHLRKNRMVVVQVREAPRAFKIKFGAGIKTRAVVIFTRQFATMINAGLPLVQALAIPAQQTANTLLAAVTRAALYDVDSGCARGPRCAGGPGRCPAGGPAAAGPAARRARRTAAAGPRPASSRSTPGCSSCPCWATCCATRR